VPYNVAKQDGLYYVLKHGKRKNKKGYKSRAEAMGYMRALYSHSPKSERA